MAPIEVQHNQPAAASWRQQNTSTKGMIVKSDGGGGQVARSCRTFPVGSPHQAPSASPGHASTAAARAAQTLTCRSPPGPTCAPGGAPGGPP
eukprot:CAMPEP_0194683862 /NCGR_PEP_ID=MMETSP0295-20121207/13719_1 /TAXON_ID=39354 /ORGANISM="Heterosigma akashiwo, Strain CCMP2393" /LENGTH=91 /DNA_ID=CAMNT_0039570695 /DNA_START=89 /DNA_END=361 /DNA_ORIENTATION=-